MPPQAAGRRRLRSKEWASRFRVQWLLQSVPRAGALKLKIATLGLAAVKEFIPRAAQDLAEANQCWKTWEVKPVLDLLKISCADACGLRKFLLGQPGSIPQPRNVPSEPCASRVRDGFARSHSPSSLKEEFSNTRVYLVFETC